MTTNYQKWMIAIMTAGLITAPMEAQALADSSQVQDAMEQARKAMQQIDSSQFRDAMNHAREAMKNFDSETLRRQMDNARLQLDAAAPLMQDLQFNFDVDNALAQAGEALAGVRGGVLGGIAGGIPGMAFAPQDRAQEARERAQEARERVREAQERVRESDDRNIEMYREGTSAVDEHRYERAIPYFDRVIANKWNRADGAYYWKAYALNKLGKRDDALAALGEISKEFPQSRWINDAKALQVEIQQAAGKPVSPENVSEEDLKLLAIQSLMNAEPEKAVPLLEKVLNDPKNNLSLKGRALYVLAQNRSDKAREIVAAYAKNGANEDLQIRAVSYVGSFRMPNSPQILSEVYSSSSDPAVKRAALRGMANARDAAHLFSAAKNEQNVDLRREAIRGLGNMQAVNELSQLYASETNNDLKEAIIDSIANGRGTDKLIEIARGEKDPNLRAYAVRRLGFMRGARGSTTGSGDALVTLYKSESDKNVKSSILRAMWQGGACQQLVNVARDEKDTDLKAEAVRALGQMRGCQAATDYLMELIAK